MSSKPKENKQVAALVYRKGKDGLRILLITSRSTKRWILTKGWPDKNEPFSRAASREACAEAGVSGKAAKRYIANYRYEKLYEDTGKILPYQVYVHPLGCKRLGDNWPEAGQRTREWFSPAEAIERLDEPELKEILRQFAKKHRQK